jgi:uncharacterized FAD-dependent dehydrogenase
MNNFDVGIIGAGVAGSFAALKIAKDHKNAKTILFDLGRPPMKRRRQLEGWLGCLPNSDGKLYLNDITKVSELVGTRKINTANTFFTKILSQAGKFKVIKDKGPSSSLEKKLTKNNFNVVLNDYIQLYPKDIHFLSKYMAEVVEQAGNTTFNFDNEVKKIYKQKGLFVIVTDEQEFKCKSLIVAVGRSGWRWAKELFTDFGIVDSNDTAKFGIRVELSSPHMKDFNKSNCTLLKDDLEIGPLSWYGTVIPEDHLDVAISAFRSNENRWKSDKVSFNLIGNRPFPQAGFEQTDRISKLTFVLSNDRILKEKVSYILTGKSKISIIPEYDWLKDAILDVESVIPDLSSKSYFHVPTIIPSAPKINIGNNLSSEIDGMFVVGESAGIHGILSAALMGTIAADQACK